MPSSPLYTAEQYIKQGPILFIFCKLNTSVLPIERLAKLLFFDSAGYICVCLHSHSHTALKWEIKGTQIITFLVTIDYKKIPTCVHLFS